MLVYRILFIKLSIIIIETIKKGIMRGRFQKNVENSDEIEIDLSRLFQEIKKKAKFIIFMAIIGGLLHFYSQRSL